MVTEKESGKISSLAQTVDNVPFPVKDMNKKFLTKAKERAPLVKSLNRGG
jgi:hypothetical protein